ncbi:MAG: hypothetical protein ICV70_02500 [Jiangellaceae bacterium]|nr:hypothetical protein [Jiangellaceae bacterium]
MTALDSDRAGRNRRINSTLLTALGAVGVAVSAYLNWFDGRPPTQIPLARLLQTQVTGNAASYWTSMAAPLALAGLLGLAGAVLRSRLAIAIAGLAGLGTLVCWVLMQALDLSPDNLGAADYEIGLWICVGSLGLLLVGLLGMPGRRRTASSATEEPATAQPEHARH